MKTTIIGILLTASATTIYAQNISRQEVMSHMIRVADWQINNPNLKPEHNELDWTQVPYYMGLCELSRIMIAQNNDSTLAHLVYRIGEKNAWQLNKRLYNADDLAIGQVYATLSQIYNDENILKPTLARAEWIVEHPSASSLMLSEEEPTTKERWSWCDALFMAPPLYARLYATTHNRKFLNYMFAEYYATTSLLYNTTDHLYFRDCRFFNMKERNGRNKYWGRGNGWVVAGLTNILDALPKEEPAYHYFLKIYTEMMTALKHTQDKNGYWHASLLDTVAYPHPETSASAFITYAMAWGINHGILPKNQYLDTTVKAWKALVQMIRKDGMLMWVQPIGAEPQNVTADMTDTYGTGAFLMAGCEIYKMVG